tara:strand:+ start:394 stop:633 length:240 start_codon:yes stop_codon:yes gene_type:complete
MKKIIKIKKLDITNEVCPMTFVKTKIFLKNSSLNTDKLIYLKGEDNFSSLKKTLRDQNYNIETENLGKSYYNILIKSSL